MTGEVPYTPFQENADSDPAGHVAGMGGGSIEPFRSSVTRIGEPFQGYTVTWDANERGPLSPDEFTVVSKMLGGLGLRLTEVGFPSAAEKEPEAVPATFDEFKAFATANGYSRTRVGKAWRALYWASPQSQRNRDDAYDPYPKIRFLGVGDSQQYSTSESDGFVDLRSVYERLAASNLSDIAWRLRDRDTGTVRFLAHLVNEKLELGEDRRLRIED